MQIAFNEEEIKHLKELYMARVSHVSPEVLATINSSDGSRDTRPKSNTQELCAPRESGAPQLTTESAPNRENEYDTGSFRHRFGSSVSRVIQSGGQSSDE